MHEHKPRPVGSKTHQYPIIKQIHCHGPVLRNFPNRQFKEVIFESFCIKTDIANHGVMIRPNVIGCVLNIVKYEDDADVVIVYKHITRYEDLYKYPVSSHTLGIYLVSKLSLLCKRHFLQIFTISL